MNGFVMSSGGGGTASGAEVVTLNVGGNMYTTTRSTLTRYPDSMLGAMFNGKYVPTSCDQQGNYFIDRDGSMFRHVLNFLRSGRLCLPHEFKDFDLLEAEADFYQISPMIVAIQEAKQPATKNKPGFYLEILDFEETAYFYRFYSDPPRGINTELKNGGLVITGAKSALLSLPLPDKTRKEIEASDMEFRTVNLSGGAGTAGSCCSKMSVIHHLQANNWQLVSTSFANSTDSDGSYMVHKYMWYQPGGSGQ